MGARVRSMGTGGGTGASGPFSTGSDHAPMPSRHLAGPAAAAPTRTGLVCCARPYQPSAPARCLPCSACFACFRWFAQGGSSGAWSPATSSGGSDQRSSRRYHARNDAVEPTDRSAEPAPRPPMQLMYFMYFMYLRPCAWGTTPGHGRRGRGPGPAATLLRPRATIDRCMHPCRVSIEGIRSPG
jgi:hypothetical protein